MENLVSRHPPDDSGVWVKLVYYGRELYYNRERAVDTDIINWIADVEGYPVNWVHVYYDPIDDVFYDALIADPDEFEDDFDKYEGDL